MTSVVVQRKEHDTERCHDVSGGAEERTRYSTCRGKNTIQHDAIKSVVVARKEHNETT